MLGSTQVIQLLDPMIVGELQYKHELLCHLFLAQATCSNCHFQAAEVKSTPYRTQEMSHKATVWCYKHRLIQMNLLRLCFQHLPAALQRNAQNTRCKQMPSWQLKRNCCMFWLKVRERRRFQVHHHFLHTLLWSTLKIHGSCKDPPEPIGRFPHKQDESLFGWNYPWETHQHAMTWCFRFGLFTQIWSAISSSASLTVLFDA